MNTADIADIKTERQKGLLLQNQKIKSLLITRKQYLEQLKQEKIQALRNVPSGKLRINNRKGNPQYYYGGSKDVQSGRYIPKAEHELVMSLAQKDYDEKILKAAEQEIRALDTALNWFPKRSVDEIYELLSEHRQSMVKPIRETDQSFVKKWIETEYMGKEFAHNDLELITDRGERVRSKSELIIANILNQEGIPYRYEYPISIQGAGTVYPDFTVLNIRIRKEILWEHQGMMDDPEYAAKAVRKVQAYIMSGYLPGRNLILTAETRNIPLNVRVIKTMIQEYCI